MNAFVVVGNMKRFDIVNHFESNDSVIWKQVSKCEIGDEVYIYVGRPLSRIMYKCRIQKKDVDSEKVEYLLSYEGKRKPAYMELELVKTLSSDGLNLKQLLDHGLKTVQCSTMMDDGLKAYIEEVTK